MIRGPASAWKFLPPQPPARCDRLLLWYFARLAVSFASPNNFHLSTSLPSSRTHDILLLNSILTTATMSVPAFSDIAKSANDVS